MDEHHPPILVALTGATGFIGRRLQLALLAHGYAVRALIRPDSRNADRLEPGCEAYPVSLSDQEALSKALEGVAAVVYCAGSVRGLRLEDFTPANVEGVEGTVATLESMPAPPPLLLISSLAASRPELSHYARSKFLGEQVLCSASRLSWSIIRPPAVYGPGDREMRPLLESIRRGIAPIVGPRQQRLSLLYVDDLAAAVVSWLKHWKACRGGVFSVDDGRAGGYDWPAIIDEVKGTGALSLRVPEPVLRAVAGVNMFSARIFGYKPMLTLGKVQELREPQWLCDNSPFTEATGWTPAVRLRQGAERLLGVA